MTRPITEDEWAATIAQEHPVNGGRVNGHGVNGHRRHAHLRAVGRPPDVLPVDLGNVPAQVVLRGLLDTPEEALLHWGDPDPIGPTGGAPEPFPEGALPSPVCEYAAAVAAHTQTPLDMAGLQCLATASTVAANRYWISGGSGWVEPLVLWTLAALPPASRKSAVVGRISAPLYDLERGLSEAHRIEHAGKADRLAIAEQRKHKIVTDLARTNSAADRGNLEAELDAVNADIERFTIPPVKQLLADDITPEALGIMLQDNEGHVGILSAEGGVFAALTGRYQQGTSQLDLILKSYDGEPFRTNRVGRSRVAVDSPAVVLGLAVQPHVLRETTKKPELRERGFMGRFAYAVPVDTVGTRSVLAPDIPEHLEQLWRAQLADLADLPVWKPTEPRPTLHLSRDALSLHHDFRQAMEPRLHEQTGDLGFMNDWAGKHAGRVLRIAGLLHLITSGRLDEVPLDTMVRAVEIGEWMLSHAVTVYGGWRVPEVDLAPARVLEWIRREIAIRTARGDKFEGFTVKDAHTALRGQAWCARAEDVKDALVALVRAGWLLSVKRLMADGKRQAGAGVFIPHPNLVEVRS